MKFTHDSNKQAQEVIFSRKTNKIDHPPLYFNQNLFNSSSNHKHLGMVLDIRLDFNLLLKKVQNKVNKAIVLLHKLHYIEKHFATLTLISFVILFDFSC